MKNFLLFSVPLFVAAMLFSVPTFAQKKHDHKHKKVHIEHPHKSKKADKHVVVQKNYNNTRIVNHNHTTIVTPSNSKHLKVLPAGHTKVVIGGVPYYRYSNNYYQWYPNLGVYQVTRSPIGTVVTNIPSGYRVVQYNGAKHYFVNGVYYRPEIRNGSPVYMIVNF
ncbi:MAG: DUF6515 family protein [Chitinophagales bacterium]